MRGAAVILKRKADALFPFLLFGGISFRRPALTGGSICVSTASSGPKTPQSSGHSSVSLTHSLTHTHTHTHTHTLTHSHTLTHTHTPTHTHTHTHCSQTTASEPKTPDAPQTTMHLLV